jgi:hypothetical protein
MFRERIILFCIVVSGLLLASITCEAKGPLDPMEKHSWTLNFGAGPGIQFYSGYPSGFGPGFQVAFETGMWKLGPGVLTLGGETGFSYFNYKGGVNPDQAPDDYYYRWLTFVVACRSAYHYGWKVRGLDTYGGVATGMRYLVFRKTFYDGYYNEYTPATFGVFGGIFVGGSYFFNSVIGLNGELGYNITYAQIGMVLKLK